ncbi:MAG: hypothetical protein KDB49_03000, partial [Mycobacterium sp.]|nr:hypothetical protein [Mycobacterium sp.]
MSGGLVTGVVMFGRSFCGRRGGGATAPPVFAGGGAGSSLGGGGGGGGGSVGLTPVIGVVVGAVALGSLVVGLLGAEVAVVDGPVGVRSDRGDS